MAAFGLDLPAWATSGSSAAWVLLTFAVIALIRAWPQSGLEPGTRPRRDNDENGAGRTRNRPKEPIMTNRIEPLLGEAVVPSCAASKAVAA